MELTSLANLPLLKEILFITITTWLTYWGAICNGFVSDDIEGLLNYEGKFCWNYGSLNKWIFLKLFNKNNIRNHLFSIILHNANGILLYLLLINFFSPKIGVCAFQIPLGL